MLQLNFNQNFLWFSASFNANHFRIRIHQIVKSDPDSYNTHWIHNPDIPRSVACLLLVLSGCLKPVISILGSLPAKCSLFCLDAWILSYQYSVAYLLSVPCLGACLVIFLLPVCLCLVLYYVFCLLFCSQSTHCSVSCLLLVRAPPTQSSRACQLIVTQLFSNSSVTCLVNVR